MTTCLWLLILGAATSHAGDESAWTATQAGIVPSAAASEDQRALTLQQVWAAVPATELLDEAVERREHGDLQGARERLEHLRTRPTLDAATFEETAYQLGVSCELQEDFGAALDQYDAVLAHVDGRALASTGGRGRDAAFRRALVLGDLDRHDEALDQVAALARADDWTAEDEAALRLLRGIAQLSRGRARRGIRQIEAALGGLEGSEEQQWLRARARTALARYLLDSADRVEMTNGRRARERLEQRAALISGAELQVIAIARLGEPEYALQGLILLGDAYLSLYDDLLAAPPPRRLDDDQVSIFQQALLDEVNVLHTKAWRYYDEGVNLGVRVHWAGASAEILRQRRDALGLTPTGAD